MIRGVYEIKSNKKDKREENSCVQDSKFINKRVPERLKIEIEKKKKKCLCDMRNFFDEFRFVSKKGDLLYKANFLLYYIFDYLTFVGGIKVLENFISTLHFKRVKNNHSGSFIFFHIPYQVRFFDLRNRDYLPKDFRSVPSYRGVLFFSLLLLFLMEWNVLKIVFLFINIFIS